MKYNKIWEKQDWIDRPRQWGERRERERAATTINTKLNKPIQQTTTNNENGFVCNCRLLYIFCGYPLLFMLHP